MASKLSKRKAIYLLSAALIVILLLVVPLAIPNSIAINSFEPTTNPMQPLTMNPSFEQGTSSWYIQEGKDSTVQLISGEGYSGSHSLYINSPPSDTQTMIIYAGNQTLPLDINSSIFFSFAMKYAGSYAASNSISSLQIVILISYQGKYPIPLLIFVGNYSLKQNYTLINQTSQGIAMIKSATLNSTWQQYILQLGTQRMIGLYQQFLKIYGLNVMNSSPADYFVTAFLIHPLNIICYLDDVGFYTSYPAAAKIVISKSTILPSNMLISSIKLDQSPVYYQFEYGILKDTYLIPVNLPVAEGITFNLVIQTNTGFMISENFTVTSGPIVI